MDVPATREKMGFVLHINEKKGLTGGNTCAIIETTTSNNDNRQEIPNMSPQTYNITEYAACQDAASRPLDEVKWTEKKARNELLSEAYLYLAEVRQPAWSDYWRRRYEACSCCGTFLTFAVDPDGTRRLQSMISCKDRLCALCTWRRSLKTYGNVKAITDYIAAHPETEGKCAYLLLTLTVRNCPRDELQHTVNECFAGLKRMINQRPFKAAAHGFFRAFEITHNVAQDTFHPHFHMIIAVRPSYFKGKKYIRQDEFARLWRMSCRLDYNPVCDVRRVRDLSGAAAEISKYTVKDSDMIDVDDWDLTAETVAAVHDALKGRRLIAYGGRFKQLHRQLNLDDDEDGDLIHVGDDALPASPEAWEVTYMWHSGYRQYIPIEKRKRQEVIDV